MANDFFKNGDKVYAENLNDSILVGNAFDWTLSISLPSDTSVFPNSSDVVKAKVCDVSITPNSNLSIGSTISNSSGSSQVYRLTVYPDFNRFGGFKSISLVADSGVTFYVANKGGSTPIVNNLDYDDLGNVPELKVLKEYDIVVSIPSGEEVEELSFVLQSSSADISGSIAQSNVSGLETRLTSIESKNTNQDGRLTALEGVDDGVFFYQVYASDYNPTIDSSITVYCRCTDITGTPVPEKSLTLFKDGSSVSSSITNSSGVASWTVTLSDWNVHYFNVNNVSIVLKAKGFKTKDMWHGTLYYDNEKVMYSLEYQSPSTYQTQLNWTDSGAFDTIPSELRPPQTVYSNTSDTRLFVRVNSSSGKVQYVNTAQISQPYFYCLFVWYRV